MMRRTTLLLTVVALAALVFASPALAAPGDLDTSFGVDSKLITDFSSQGDQAGAVAVQQDDKILQKMAT